MRSLWARRSATLLLASNVAALIAGAALLRRPLDRILDVVGSDDLFYYLVVEWSATLGLAFDSTQTTSGVQPLWWLVARAVATLVPHANQPVVLLGVALLVHQASAWLLLFWMREVSVFRVAALPAALLWSLHPRGLRVVLEGTEAALLGLTALLALVLWVRELDRAGAGRRGATRALPVVLALLVLVRIDMVALALFLSAFAWSGDAPRLRGRRALWVASPWVTALALWFGVAWTVTGSPWPDSGAAKVLHRQLLEASQAGPPDCETDRLSLPADLSNAATALAGARVTALHLLRNGEGVVAGSIAWSLAALALVALAAARRLRPAAAALLPLSVGVLTTGGYLLTLGFPRSWYLVPLLLLQAALGAWVCTATCLGVARGVRSGWAGLMPKGAGPALAALIWVAISWSEAIRQPARPMNGHVYRFAAEVAEVLPETSRVGAFNAGIPGFVLGHRAEVINLDGVVHHAAIDALRTGRLADLLLASKVEYLFDFEGSLRHFDSVSCEQWLHEYDTIRSRPVETNGTSIVLLSLTKSGLGTER